ncbi:MULTISPECIES: DUF2267 domain-containing protein [Streptomyces]|uniref:DUF2267 domain-containing protein n=1 Tax=Streptomyces cacaoi TaxID=1898 RepID=A0A4Y3R0N2_STRCI|nr:MULTISPECIES: DUF2267 domain-containing protein [Streptomyces]NNG86021.1 DUF2267 domain-containing protein [Streptomyces cacaoi]QHF94256.1 DUF2267 domain-containing protein [Streptomyces sp. NHF165]GEB51246.1 hypothetical protein SCA03_37970 [Streptomyces cacaoi]
MTYGTFLSEVRDRGNYPDRGEAVRVSEAVMTLLGARLQPASARHLASQLPERMAGTVTHDGRGATTWSEGEFVERVRQATGAENTGVARRHAEAVCQTICDQVSGGERNKLLSQLPSGYAPLFGHPELH